MSAWALVGGVAAFNACLLAVGYAVSAPFHAGLGLRVRASYAGVCLLVGAALVGVLLSMLAYTRVHVGLAAFAAVCGSLIAAGLAASFFVRTQPKRVAAQPEHGWPAAVTVAAGYCVFAICAIALVGGFRSSPWLDDSWFFWLPKGIVLDRLGLRDALFAGGGEFVPFTNPDYPFWWSIVMNLDTRFVGGIDLRAINAQLTVFEIAFVGAAARLLWGRVRPWVLWTGLLALIVAPELLREAQGGSADFPLAVFLALFALTAALWLATRDAYALFLAFAFAATAIALKLEGWAVVLIVVVVASAFARRAGLRTLVLFWAVSLAAALTAAPWYRWKSNVAASVTGENVSSWDYLGQRSERVARSAGQLADHAFNPREWAIVVPLLIALSIAAAVRERRLLWLAPLTGFVLLFAFWVVAFWTAPEDRISGSVYRVVMSAIVPAAVFVPVLGERLVATFRRS